MIRHQFIKALVALKYYAHYDVFFANRSSSKSLNWITALHQFEKVQVGKDQEKAQSEKDSHSKKQGGKKNILTIRYIYHENIS